MIKIFLSISFLLVFFACNDAGKVVERTKPSTDRNSAAPFSATISIDSMLFAKEFALKFSQNSSAFVLTSDTKQQLFHAEANINGRIVSYNLEVVRLNPNSKFSWESEDSYRVKNLSISVDKLSANITNLHFANKPSTIVYPSGVWHWAVEDCSLKLFEGKVKQYYFINGASLFCNGTGCNTNQLYVVVKHKNALTVSALEYDDLLPYYFLDMSLFDKNSDGIPEFYLPFGDKSDELIPSNFQYYSFDNNNKITAW